MEQEQAKPASFNDSSILFLPTLLSLKKNHKLSNKKYDFNGCSDNDR